MLTQWFDPEPTFKGLAFARELHKQGFEVEVLTGFPNYPGGKLYPGYRMRLLQREIIDGVSVTRVPLYPNHDQSAIKRVLNYLSFAASAMVYGVLFARRADVVYAYHPPLTVGMAAAVIRFFRRTPVVYDIQDMWPDTLRATGMLNNPKALSLVGTVCKAVYRCMDRLVVLSPGFKRLLIERGVPEQKIDVIYNWCDEGAIVDRSPGLSHCVLEKKFSVLFAGNMGKAQSLESVLRAAEIVKKVAPAVSFDFLGGGVEVPRLKALAESMGLSNVSFRDSVPMSQVGPLLRGADVLLVHLKKDPLFEVTIPSKTQAYMAVGRPILMAVDGDAAHLVRESHCGRIAASEDPESIAKAVLEMYALDESERENMARRGSDYYIKNLSFSRGVEKFCRVFKAVAVKA